MLKLNKQIAIGVTAALLLIPFNAAITLADGQVVTAGTTVTAPTLVVPPTSTPTAGSTSLTLPPVLNASGQPVLPGTLPTSPFYWLANLVQKIQLIFTFDPTQKIALSETQALQSLAAAREMADQGKVTAMQAALTAYADKAAQSAALLHALHNPNPQTFKVLQSAIMTTNLTNLQDISFLMHKADKPNGPLAKRIILALNMAANANGTTDPTLIVATTAGTIAILPPKPDVRAAIASERNKGQQGDLMRANLAAKRHSATESRHTQVQAQAQAQAQVQAQPQPQVQYRPATPPAPITPPQVATPAPNYRSNHSGAKHRGDDGGGDGHAGQDGHGSRNNQPSHDD
ncbi:MAG: DUF5667 domain-containing protein [Peptococcaceae bacterium]|nr:DUF5667 domain-containing protein [Peptococcaceae bacterium]